MKKVSMVLGLLILLAALPALAGEEHKCTASTQDCLNMMASNMKGKGLIGVEGEWLDDINGYRVDTFLDGSTAETAGVRAGDVLVAINGIALDDDEASKADRANREPGSKVAITLLREGKKQDMKVTLIPMSDEQIAGYVGAHMLDHAVIAQAD